MFTVTANLWLESDGRKIPRSAFGDFMQIDVGRGFQESFWIVRAVGVCVTVNMCEWYSQDRLRPRGFFYSIIPSIILPFVETRIQSG